jgi:hypothetical protein
MNPGQLLRARPPFKRQVIPTNRQRDDNANVGARGVGIAARTSGSPMYCDELVEIPGESEFAYET